jgi:hypothetical protein
MRTAFALLALVVLGGVGCSLPTEPVQGNCAKDDQCPTGWKCGTDRSKADTFYRCVCASASCQDAGQAGDVAEVQTVDASTDVRGKCQRNTDCPAERPLCATTGECVECFNPTHCKDPGKSFCVATVCTGCQGAGPNACQSPMSICDPTSNRCVECTADGQCSADPLRPLCVASACVGCAKAATGGCAKKDATKPACGPAGACVECNDSPDCTQPAKSICVSNKCEACTTDTQCAARNGPNPGVCLTHQGGFCLTDDATIYVQNAATCSSAPTAGTAAIPFCKPQDALAKVTNAFKNVVIRGPAAVAGLTWSNATVDQLNIIGQQSATIAGGADPGIKVSSGANLFARNLTVTASIDVGISASTNATLHLDHVTVRDNQKGGLLVDGAGFEVRDATFTGNGPGQFGLASWGGVLINMPPASSPALLDRLTIRDNKQVGLSCSGSVSGSGVLATGNSGGVDIAPTCGILTCAPAGPTCGAQP